MYITTIALILAFMPAVGYAEADLYLAPAVAQSAVPKAGFIAVEGGTLASRMSTAVSRGRASGAARFWTAYAFDVRPGVSVDSEYDGRGKGMHWSDDNFNVNTRAERETRNLAIFVLHAQGSDRAEKIRIYNLDRDRDYEKLPVYWLGRAASGESIAYLQQLLDAFGSDDAAERTVAAIALHADPQAAVVLENLARQARSMKARHSALIWTGITSESAEFLAAFARDEREPRELRKDAMIAIGIGSAPSAVATLRDLYNALTDEEIKQQALDAVAIHGNSREKGEAADAAAVDFLVEVAGNEKNADLRRHALFWVGQIAGERGRGVLESALESSDDEVAEQAVFAISQRPSDESVPILLRVAREHKNREVRKKAIFWLGQSDDPRALAFFKEMLER
jgi:hypothetical protein